MNHVVNSSLLLRKAMRSNAAFSTVSGLAMLLAAKPLSQFIGVPSKWILVGLGVSLLIFAVGLFRNSGKAEPNLLEAAVAIALDFAWVGGSVVLLVASILSPGGDALVAVIASVVLVLAVLQLLGLQKIRLLASESRP